MSMMGVPIADRDEVAHLTKPAQSFAAGPLDERRDQ
jgi:hypothetical protein